MDMTTIYTIIKERALFITNLQINLLPIPGNKLIYQG